MAITAHSTTAFSSGQPIASVAARHALARRRQPVLSRTTTRWSGAAESPRLSRGIRGSRIGAASAGYLASGVGRAGHDAKRRLGDKDRQPPTFAMRLATIYIGLLPRGGLYPEYVLWWNC